MSWMTWRAISDGAHHHHHEIPHAGAARRRLHQDAHNTHALEAGTSCKCRV